MNLRRSKRQTERGGPRSPKNEKAIPKSLKRPPSPPKRGSSSKLPNKGRISPRQLKSPTQIKSNEVETNNNISDKDIIDAPELGTRKRRGTGRDDYINRKFLYDVADNIPRKRRATNSSNAKGKPTSAIALVAASSTKLHNKRQASKKKKSVRGNSVKTESRVAPDRTGQHSQSGNESDNMTGPLETGAVDSFLGSEDDEVDAVGLERLLMATQDISASRSNRKLEKRFFQASRKRPHLKNEFILFQSSDTDVQDQVDSDQSDDFFMHSDPPQTSYHRNRMAALGAATDAALDDLGSDLDVEPPIHHKSAYPCYRTSGGSDDLQEDDNDEDFSGDLLSPNVILTNQHPLPTASVSSSRRKSPIRPMQVLPIDPNHDYRNRRQSIYRNPSPYNSPHKRRATTINYSDSVNQPTSMRGPLNRDQNQVPPAEPPSVSLTTQLDTVGESGVVDAVDPSADSNLNASGRSGSGKEKGGASSSSSNSTTNTPGNKGKAPIPPRYRPSILQRKSKESQVTSQSHIATLSNSPLTSMSDMPTATVLPTGNVVLTSDPNSLDSQSGSKPIVRQISTIVTNHLSGTGLHTGISSQQIGHPTQVIYQKAPLPKPHTASAKLFGKRSQEISATETSQIEVMHSSSISQRNSNLVTLSTSIQSSTVPLVVQPNTTVPYTMVRAATKGKNIVLLGPQGVNSGMTTASIMRPTIVRTNARSILRTNTGAVVTPVVSGGTTLSSLSSGSGGQGLIVVRSGDGITRMLPTCTAGSTEEEELEEEGKREESDFDRAFNTPANPVSR